MNKRLFKKIYKNSIRKVRACSIQIKTHSLFSSPVPAQGDRNSTPHLVQPRTQSSLSPPAPWLSFQEGQDSSISHPASWKPLQRLSSDKSD